MLIRAIALSIALLVGIGTIIPLATGLAEASSGKAKKFQKRKRHWRGVRKYSKRWWQLYRAQERRKVARAKQWRSLRLRQIRLAKIHKAEVPEARAAAATKARPMAADADTSMLPSGQSAPKGWKRGKSTGSELQFSVDDGNGMAAISVVGPAMGETVDAGRNQAVGGVPTSSLRREVINRMIRENGWVVNDFQKEIGGRNVYVVVAQSQAAGGSVHSRMFYFTEVDGRIYSVATTSPTQSADRIAEESEKVINSLQSRVRPVQQAVKE